LRGDIVLRGLNYSNAIFAPTRKDWSTTKENKRGNWTNGAEVSKKKVACPSGDCEEQFLDGVGHVGG